MREVAPPPVLGAERTQGLPRPLVAVVGPTGTGKSDLALALAERLDGEIVSVDSAQVFRGLDIGTAKPTGEERARVPHHLIDVIEPSDQWSAAEYARAADAVIAAIAGRRRTPVLCGGTGLWLRALVQGIFEAPPIEPALRRAVREAIAVRGAPALHHELAAVDPVAAARIQPTDPQRIARALEVYRQVGVPISVLQAQHGFRERRYDLHAVGLAWSRDLLADRLAARARAMYARGLVEETRAVMARGVAPDAPGLATIGYRDATRCVLGEIAEDEAIERTIVATRQYAKRQRNWFRSVEVAWFEPGVQVDTVHAWLRGRSATV